jgi:hypothetical protein
MTDTQVIRRKISQNCINLLEKQAQKSRVSQDEIQNIIISEVVKVVKNEY